MDSSVAETRPIGSLLPRNWITSRALVHGMIFLSAIAFYLRFTHGPRTEVTDDVAATGVLLTILTLQFVALQIDIALRIAANQNELIGQQTEVAREQAAIASRQTTILERQDQELRRLPDLTLRFVGTDPSFLMTATRPDLATKDHVIDVRIAIANAGAPCHGAVVELQLPDGINIAAGSLDWHLRKYLVTGSQTYTFYRAEFPGVSVYEGEPTELPTLKMTCRWIPVPLGTPWTEFPDGYLVSYRIVSQGRNYPLAEKSVLRILPATFSNG